MTFNGGWQSQISKVKYLSNHWSNFSQIFNLSLCDQTKLYNCFKSIWHPMKDNFQWNTTSTIKSVSKEDDLEVTWEFFGGNHGKNSEIILNMALLSPACFLFCLLCNYPEIKGCCGGETWHLNFHFSISFFLKSCYQNFVFYPIIPINYRDKHKKIHSNFNNLRYCKIKNQKFKHH
jgi:hypothetical protein